MNDRNKDTPKKKYRIDGFLQMKRFFEIVDDNPDISNTEISLYFYLLNLNNGLAWREWFTVSKSEGMNGSKLCERAYYKALDRLESLLLIDWRKGVKNKPALIKIMDLKAVDSTIHKQLLNDSKAVDSTAFKHSKAVDSTIDVQLFNNSITKKVTKKKGVTQKEKKTPTFQNEKSFSLNEKNEMMIQGQIQVTSAEELKKYLMDHEFIRLGSIALKIHEQTFSKHVEQWTEKKEISGDFHYKVCRLKTFCMDDYKHQAENKSISWAEAQTELERQIREGEFKPKAEA